MSYNQRNNKQLSRDPYLYGVRDYVDLKETSQDSVNGDTPRWWQLALGIPAFLFSAGLMIWMSAILLDGCNPPDAYANETTTEQIMEDQQGLDNLLLTLIENQRENQQ